MIKSEEFLDLGDVNGKYDDSIDENDNGQMSLN